MEFSPLGEMQIFDGRYECNDKSIQQEKLVFNLVANSLSIFDMLAWDQCITSRGTKWERSYIHYIMGLG